MYVRRSSLLFYIMARWRCPFHGPFARNFGKGRRNFECKRERYSTRTFLASKGQGLEARVFWKLFLVQNMCQPAVLYNCLYYSILYEKETLHMKTSYANNTTRLTLSIACLLAVSRRNLKSRIRWEYVCMCTVCPAQYWQLHCSCFSSDKSGAILPPTRLRTLKNKAGDALA